MTDSNAVQGYMPMMPAYAGNNEMFGGNGLWFLLIWMAMFGWSNNGFGGNNGYSEVQRGFDQNSVMSGIAAIQNTQNQAEISAANRQMSNMNQFFQMQSAFQNCCCENRLATTQLGTAIAQEGAATRAASANDRQMIMDKLCQLEMDGIKQNYENRIAGMQSALDQARTDNQNLRFLASQGAQTAQILNELNNNNTCTCGV